ncbi:ABC transporter ATP-binding protein [Mycobacterium heckeshornense]|uniref:ABC transporter ATP-binding/permease Rv1747 n=2 Tax=Mycobacterium heckeshornense TaxID=110505 RepID=A0A2G8BBS4_9MYCO|nr:ATP-binding cassette domain-containing protein [Mycobacterium heckeshornense]PIJ35227.1 ABC transporter ATP-binding protein [Mycobacterium heckeshornense]BCO38077.1 ABC transporter ATP-binding/permease Rv1747 [Mycobacterium heckeshornense]
MTPTKGGGLPFRQNYASPHAVVSQASSPPLTVWLGSAMYIFPVDRDITIGRDRDCDICLHDRDRAGLGLISRMHAILRFDGAQWVAVDKSQNGVFVDGVRSSMVAIRDRQKIALGSPHGPQLTFRVATSPEARELRNPPTLNRLTGTAARSANANTMRVARPQPRHRERLGDTMRFLLPPRPGAAPPGSKTIGRATTNDVVVNDALASRKHAVLLSTPHGVEIRDNNSSNGTFVNGTRITRALLRDGDVVTIGNTDLVASGTTLLPRGPARGSGLNAHGLGLSIDGHTLLTNVSFTARPGTLTAVIGPSGAGKSTLVKLIGGIMAPTAGVVSFDGHDVHTEYASMRSRIGMVPQDDVVHRQLTVEQALGYAAELRLPPDTSPADRRAVVRRVLDELELTPHRKTRVDKLSGGQRKRASVAMELLTGPSLLILDEPTSGLDPALDRQVMTMLRRLADAGRVVIVVTHSLSYVTMCDQLVLLAPGGKTAFAEPPAQIRQVMGTTDWADIFARVSTDPDGVHRAYLTRHPAPPRAPSTTSGTVPLGAAPHTSLWRQISTITRRQIRLIAADRGYFAFLAALPFVLGALLLAVPGNTGLGFADPRGSQPDEPSEILILLNIAAVFMGTALTIRDLVGERTIFKREQAVGLSASAYLLAKVLAYTVAAVIQTAVVTTILIAGKGAPTRGAVLLGNGTAELYLTLAATAIASAMVGLVLSSLARSTEQILPLLVVAIMVSMVLAGGLIPVTGRMGLSQVSWLVPARWGFAASASTVDLRHIEMDLPADRLWLHSPRYWLLDMGMLVALGLAATGFVRFRLRLPARGHSR